MKKIEPTQGYVLVEPIELENKSSSGIIIATKRQTFLAKVLAIGEKPDNYNVVDFKIGDEIVFSKWEGIRFRFELTDKPMLFLKFEHILAVKK